MSATFVFDALFLPGEPVHIYISRLLNVVLKLQALRFGPVMLVRLPFVGL
jgi:hypothetical protein